MKKAKKKQNSQPKMSAERYMRERVKNLPMGKCYINPEWKEEGMAHIVVTRNRAGGHIVFASFLVDTLCLGVKDADYAIDFTPEEMEEAMAYFRKSHELTETDYNTIHNLIYGAIEFAEEGGISPVKEFITAGNILEEDTDDIPLVEFDYGKDGKHFLIIGPDGREQKYLQTLSDHLGEDFSYVDMREDYEEESEGMRDLFEEKERHTEEEYNYKHPEYPGEPIVKHQIIAEALLSPDNYEELPKDDIKRIIALPDDEAAEDISNIMLYTIGNTYKAIENDTIGDPEEGALLHGVILLSQLQSQKGLPGFLELLRQSEKFIDFHFGDLSTEMIPTALAATASDNLPALEAFLYEPGIGSRNRTIGAEALSATARIFPEKREEVIEAFRKLLTSMKDRLPKRDACDASFAGFVASDLIDIEAKELIPEIRELFATDCVDKSIAGDCDEVVEAIEHNVCPRTYEIPTIQEQYEFVRSFE